MAKQEPIPVAKLKYDVSVYNPEFETRITYKSATLSFLIDSLKKMDGLLKTNVKVGNTVKGNSTNSRNAKPNPNQHLKIK